MVYNGDVREDYQDAYQLKTNEKDVPSAWNDLINLCKTLEETPWDEVEAKLSPIFDIDRALWFLALENVFIDNDGYFSRGSDYSMYQDPTGRFHLLPYDSNETFRFAGGGGAKLMANRWSDAVSRRASARRDATRHQAIVRGAAPAGAIPRLCAYHR